MGLGGWRLHLGMGDGLAALVRWCSVGYSGYCLEWRTYDRAAGNYLHVEMFRALQQTTNNTIASWTATMNGTRAEDKVTSRIQELHGGSVKLSGNNSLFLWVY